MQLNTFNYVKLNKLYININNSYVIQLNTWKNYCKATRIGYDNFFITILIALIIYITLTNISIVLSFLKILFSH